MKIHRSCLKSKCIDECHGTLKPNIRTDTFDTFKNIFKQTTKKKDDENDGKSKFYNSNDHQSNDFNSFTNSRYNSDSDQSKKNCLFKHQ